MVPITIFIASLIMLNSSSEPDPTSVEAESARGRDAIVAGDLVFDVSYGSLDPSSGDLNWRDPVFKDRMVFDRKGGLRAFVERWVPHPTTFVRGDESLSQSDAGGGNLRRIIIRPDAAYEFYPIALNDGSHLPILEFKISDEPAVRGSVFSPWNFAVIPDVIEAHRDRTFESIIKTLPDSPPKVTAETIGGRECWLIEYHTYDERVVNVWYDINRGMAVIRIVVQGSHEHGAWRNTMNSNYSQFENGVWFPTEVVLRSEMLNQPLEAGKNFLLHRVRVLQACFNINIASEQFTLKAFDSPAHTGIYRQFDSELPAEEWDGEKVAKIAKTKRIRLDQQDGNIKDSVQHGRWRTVLLLAGNAIFIIACIIGFSLHRHKA